MEQKQGGDHHHHAATSPLWSGRHCCTIFLVEYWLLLRDADREGVTTAFRKKHNAQYTTAQRGPVDGDNLLLYYIVCPCTNVQTVGVCTIALLPHRVTPRATPAKQNTLTCDTVSASMSTLLFMLSPPVVLLLLKGLLRGIALLEYGAPSGRGDGGRRFDLLLPPPDP